MELEICTNSYNSALAAQQGGADRIELCVGLAEGGLTPSMGLIKQVAQLSGLKKHVLIRPRGGDFCYTPDEVAIMETDIRLLKEEGIDGVVIGALNPDGTIDLPTMRRLITAAEGLSITFHRAFDMCANPEKALEDIIALGCHRILTSGLSPTAEQGIPMLRKLVELSGRRIEIMPGCGVTPQNAARILRGTGATNIHASAKHTRDSVMAYRRDTIDMGEKGKDEFAIQETSPRLVAEIRQAIG